MAKKKKKKGVNAFRIIRSLLIVLVVCGMGFGAYVLLTNKVPDQSQMEIVFDAGTILPTTTINGVDVSNLTAAQARVAIDDQVQQKAGEIAVKLQYPDGRVELLSAATIGVFPNADDTIRSAMLTGRQGGITQRKTQLASGTIQSFALSYTYDQSALEQNIRTAAASLNTAAVEPAVTVDETDHLVVTAGKDGVQLDVEKFVSLVKDAVTNGTFGPVAMPGTVLKPNVSTESVQANTQKRSTFTTTYTDASTSGRAMNIKKMVDVLSGQVLQPGQEFSVNTIAGDRTIANGWYMAKGIENGVYTDQPGGGICQVSTTLYDAVLKSDLQITSRKPHTIPSHYVDPGFDATVSTGGPDLKFVNNTEYTIYVIMYTDESKGTGSGVAKTVTAEIWGAPLEKGFNSVRLVSQTTENDYPYDWSDVNYVTDPALVHGSRNKIVATLYKYYYDGDWTKSGTKLIKMVQANTSTYAPSKPSMLVGTTPTPILSPTPSLSPSPTPTKTPVKTPIKTATASP